MKICDAIWILFIICLNIFTIVIHGILINPNSIQEVAKKFGVQMLNVGYERTCFGKISEVNYYQF